MTTTHTETLQRQLPLAMQALGIHMQINDLPSFWSIEVRGDQVFVHLRRGAAEPWLRSAVIDAERNEHRPDVDSIRTEWDIRLPDTGFLFTLVEYRQAPVRSLIVAAVPA